MAIGARPVTSQPISASIGPGAVGTRTVDVGAFGTEAIAARAAGTGTIDTGTTHVRALVRPRRARARRTRRRRMRRPRDTRRLAGLPEVGLPVSFRTLGGGPATLRRLGPGQGLGRSGGPLRSRGSVGCGGLTAGARLRWLPVRHGATRSLPSFWAIGGNVSARPQSLKQEDEPRRRTSVAIDAGGPDGTAPPEVTTVPLTRPAAENQALLPKSHARSRPPPDFGRLTRSSG